MYSRTRLHCGFLSLKHNSTRNARAPGMERALERTLWAHGTEWPLERTIWAHRMERALEWAPLPWVEPVLECQLTVPTSWVDPPACVPARISRVRCSFFGHHYGHCGFICLHWGHCSFVAHHLWHIIHLS